MSIGDFHNHTNHSDGKLTPQQLITKAYRNNVRYIAITDHDSISGIADAKKEAAKYKNIHVISGIELSIDIYNEDVHMLGLFINETYPDLLIELEILKKERENRAIEIINVLKKQNIILEWEKIKIIANNATIGRPHIAQAMIDMNYVSSVQEAFNKYLAQENIINIKRIKLKPKDAMELINKAGGISVLAHPMYLKKINLIIKELKKYNLFGIETYYKNYDIKTINNIKLIAKKNGLFTSGGSDYHGIHGNMEKEPGDIPLPNEIVKELIQKQSRNQK
jgi:3',5'-nucleoside bisphosphate phosphatase